MSMPRRSGRQTKGIPPEKYGDLDEKMEHTKVSSHQGSIKEKTNSKVESRLTKSSCSRRKLIEIELEEARKLAEIEKRKAEIDAEMIRKEAQLQRELIQEGSSKISTISGAGSILDLNEMTIQEKVVNWKTDETEINNVPTTTNFITMTAENLKEICNTLKVNSDKVKYTDRTEGFKYKLPIFDGNPEDWPIFQSQFERSTKIFNICDEENIIRFQKCLKGRARDTVQPLLVAPENVKKILETLKITFGRPEFIISNLIDKVRRATPPKEGKFETYLPFSNVVENLVTTMELFNNTGHMTNPSILNEIVMKLPPFLRLKWAEEISLETNVTLKTFSVWMRKIAIAASSCTDFNSLNLSEKRAYEHDKFQNRKSANIFSTKKFDKCPCCQKNHLLIDCQNFKKIDIDEKWKLVTSKKLCFNCLKPSHNIYSCKVKQKCGIDNCQKFHNNILHKVDCRREDDDRIVNPQNDCKQDERVERINFFQEENPTILLRIIPVKLRGKIKEISTFALLDEAATTSMIDSKIAQEIGLDGPVEPLCYQWLNNVTKNEENSKRVSLQIAGVDVNSKMYRMNNVRTVSGLSLPRQTIDVEKMSESYPYIKKTPVHSFYDAQPTILIGQDQCALSIARNIYQSYWNAPFVSKTLLGWVVHGRYPQGNEVSENSLIFHVCCKSQEEIHEDINKLEKDSFKIESFDMKCSEENGSSEGDNRTIEIMENTGNPKLQAQSNGDGEKDAEKEDKAKQEKAQENSRPVSSTPVPGTQWCDGWTVNGKVFFYNPSSRTSMWESPEELLKRTDVDKMVSEPPNILTCIKSAVKKLDVKSPGKTKMEPDDSHSDQEEKNVPKKPKLDESPDVQEVNSTSQPPGKKIDIGKEAAIEAAKERAVIPLERKMRERESLFNEYLIEVRKKEERFKGLEKNPKREQIEKDFYAWLREHSDIDRHFYWGDVKRKIHSHARYKAIESGGREDWSIEYRKMLNEKKKRAKEKDREHKREKKKHKKDRHKDKKDKENRKPEKEKNVYDYITRGRMFLLLLLLTSHCIMI